MYLDSLDTGAIVDTIQSPWYYAHFNHSEIEK